MILSLNLLKDIINFISHGTVIGLHAIVFMVIPFSIGLVLGFLVKNFLKWES